MAPAPVPGTPQPSFLATLVPLLLPSLLFAVAALWLAPRKGRSRWLALLGFIPCGGCLVILYLLCLTDKQVLDDIEMLKRQTGNSDDQRTPKG